MLAPEPETETETGAEGSVPVTVIQTVESSPHASSVTGVATTLVTAAGWYKLEMYATEVSTEERALEWLGEPKEEEV